MNKKSNKKSFSLLKKISYKEFKGSLLRYVITVFSCVTIIVMGTGILAYATTTVGENIITNILTTTGLTVNGNATTTGNLTVDTDTFYVDSENNRVGIGTSTPEASLSISSLDDLVIVNIFAPNQTDFDDSLIIGNGGQLISRTGVNPVDPLEFESDGSFNGKYNTFVGINAGLANTTGNMNTFIGANAGVANINGDQNTFIGVHSGMAMFWMST